MCYVYISWLNNYSGNSQFSELKTQDTMNAENQLFVYLLGNFHQQTNNDQQNETEIQQPLLNTFIHCNDNIRRLNIFVRSVEFIHIHSIFLNLK